MHVDDRNAGRVARAVGWNEWLAELVDQQLAALPQGEGAESTVKVMRRDKVVTSEKK